MWKKTEFYKGENDGEVIVVAAGGLREGAESLLQQADFPIMEALPSHGIFSSHHELILPPRHELILKGTLRKFSACDAYFYENLQFKNF